MRRLITFLSVFFALSLSAKVNVSIPDDLSFKAAHPRLMVNDDDFKKMKKAIMNSDREDNLETNYKIKYHEETFNYCIDCARCLLQQDHRDGQDDPDSFRQVSRAVSYSRELIDRNHNA